MKEAAIVGLGGCIGSVARYLLGGLISQHSGALRFPMPTFLVNIGGCLVIGILAGLSARLNLFNSEAKLFLFTGLLGGFTTFSSFGLETFSLLKRGEMGVAALYVGLSVVVGLALVWAGFRATGG